MSTPHTPDQNASMPPAGGGWQIASDVPPAASAQLEPAPQVQQQGQPQYQGGQFQPQHQQAQYEGQPQHQHQGQPQHQGGQFQQPGFAQANGVMPGVAAPFGIEPTTGLPYSPKSKVVAGVLELFLGGIGAGRFYKGDIGIGILQFLCCFCLGWFTFGVTYLWPLIDGILMLTGRPTDKQGRPLRG